jgi:site-specific DNA-cytosine methylase
MVKPEFAPDKIASETRAEAKIEPVEDGAITPEWCKKLQQGLLAATWAGATACRCVLPARQLMHVINQAGDLFKVEPTLLEVRSNNQALAHM